MNGFWGADTDALRTMGSVCARRADLLDELEGMLSATIDGVEWVGEDAERFRAEWSGTVRTGLQDRSVELRQQARRLAQHAEEQETASSPDSPDGLGGPWSSPGQLLADVSRLAQDVLRDLLGGGAAAPGADGRLAEGALDALLREVLRTPEGRAAFLGAFLAHLLGGLLAELVRSGLALGMMLEELLTGLGPGGGIGNLIGEAGRTGESGADAAGSEGASGSGGDPASGDASGSGGAGGGGGAESGSGSGSGSGGGGSSSGSSEGGGSDPSGPSGASDAEGGTAGAEATPRGVQGLVDGPEKTPGSHPAGRLDNGGDEEPGTLFERLIAMIGEMLGGGAGTAGAGAGTSGGARGTAAIGDGIGWG
jgi:hypothetical protein